MHNEMQIVFIEARPNSLNFKKILPLQAWPNTYEFIQKQFLEKMLLLSKNIFVKVWPNTLLNKKG